MCDHESSSSDDDVLLFASKVAVLCSRKTKKRKNPRYWLSSHIRCRETTGEFSTLFYELNDESFKNYYRVTRQQFEDILTLIYDDIRKMDTTYRKAITPKERLAVCLRYVLFLKD